MRKIFSLTLLLICTTAGLTQRIKTGYPFPDMIVYHVINYPASSLKISDFKGKLVLLDFWNHTCTACIKSFSKLDSLQKIFNGKIQIILVNRESKDSTERFFKKRNKLKMPDLPMATGDEKLMSLFPVDGYPYSVWIDSRGTVKYFSGTYNITSGHINDLLNGKELNLRNVTLVKYGSLTNQRKFEYFSAISNCSDTIDVGSSEIDYTNNNKSLRMASNCSSVIELYKKAYKEYNKYNPGTSYGLVLEVADSSMYIYPTNPDFVDNWLKENSFNYELILPISKKEQRYKIMQEDLKRYFELEASIEKRKTESIVLVNSKNKTMRNGNQKEWPGDSTGKLIIQPYGLFMKEIRSKLEYYYPVFDETTGFKNKTVSIREKSINPINLENLRKDLIKNNINLVFEKRKTPVLLIREKK